MSTFKMTPELLTGNAMIDRDHENLFSALNNLIESIGKGETGTKVNETLRYLLNYTKTHFAREEQLQKKYDYPDYDRHKKFHEYFTKSIEDTVNFVEKNEMTLEIAAKINIRSGGELLAHILHEDKALAKFLANQVTNEEFKL